jgi:chloramphenicol-sensitive protein RarD
MMKQGILLAIGANVLWGLLPVYWNSIHGVDALELASHRAAWTFGVLVLVQTIRNSRHWIRNLRLNPRANLCYIGSAAILAANWLLYLWGVSSGHVVDLSLAYFIQPLVAVLFGVLIVRERLRAWQSVAVIIGAGGVVFLTIQYGQFPGFAIVLALAFGLYGLLRKLGSLPSMEGLMFETGSLFLPALFCLFYLEIKGTGTFGHVNLQQTLLLGMSGVVTAGPLLLFGSSIRKIPLSMMGMLQYILPTILFILGVFVYREDCSSDRLTGFIIIWIALVVYSVEGLVHRKLKG